MNNSLNAGQKINGLTMKPKGNNDFDKLAEIVTAMDSSQPLKNLPLLTQSLKQASGFIKNRYQKRDFKCLNKILQNHLGLFRQLQQQAQNLSIDLTCIHQQNNRKEKRIRKLQSEKHELEECSNLMTEYALKPDRKQFDNTIKGIKANHQVQIKTQMNKNMTKKPKKDDFDLHFSNIQFGGVYIPQQGDSNILKKFKSYEYKKDIVEESQIYSQLKIGQQVQERFVNRPNSNYPQEQKGIKIVRPSQVKEFVNYNPQAQKEALHPLPSMLQSKLSLISLPSSLQSNIPQPKTANKKVSY